MAATTLSPEKVKKIWKDSFAKSVTVKKLPFKELVIISTAVNIFIIVVVLILIRLKRIPPEVPLFYGSAEGRQLANSLQLILPQALSLIFLGINTALSIVFKDEFIKKTLIIGAVASTFLAAVTTIKIIYLVGYL